MSETRTGYTLTSIIFHWLTAIVVIALFFTGEGKGIIRNFHIAAGALFGIFLIWRLVWRVMRGMTTKPDQPALFNLLSSVVIWGLLLSTFIATITGYLLPWARGAAINVFDLFVMPSPMASNNGLHEFFEELHEISSNFLILLVLVHILGTLKHHFFDKDDVAKRMVVPVKKGR